MTVVYCRSSYNVEKNKFVGESVSHQNFRYYMLFWLLKVYKPYIECAIDKSKLIILLYHKSGNFCHYRNKWNKKIPKISNFFIQRDTFANQLCLLKGVNWPLTILITFPLLIGTRDIDMLHVVAVKSMLCFISRVDTIKNFYRLLKWWKLAVSIFRGNLSSSEF